MSLKGGPQLRARLKAIKGSFKLQGRQWADEVVRLGRPSVPVRTGRLRRSLRVRNASQRRATVVGHFTAYFIDKGTVVHPITARGRALRFKAGGHTVFAKRVMHPRLPAHPFRARIAREALRRHPLSEGLIESWNKAA